MLATLASTLLLATSGAHGKVLIDPARPVCMAGRPCSAPDPKELLRFWRGKKGVASTTTASNGTFRVALAPGVYRVTLPRQRLARVTPTEFVVRAGRDVRVVFRVDVGIR